MKIDRIFLLAGLAALLSLPAIADDGRVYEMRTYYANEGKLDALLTRFRDHTVDLFEKHGMTNVGYFVPADNPDNKLVYFLSYPSRDARDKSWKAFLADPVWKAAYAASTENGKLVGKIDKLFLQATDYSPKLKIKKSKKPRFFELRAYTAAEGKMDYLDYRFKEDTIGIFKNNGMTNVIYWHPMADQEGHGNTLIYLLAYDSEEGHKKAWAGFRADPDWKAALARSNERAGGGLLVKKGVKSTLLNSTDFSDMR
jgi:hypothetical protein